MHIVIPGLPKCGTTSLYNYFITSGKVSRPTQKEGQYILNHSDKIGYLKFLKYNKKYYTIDASTSYATNSEHIIPILKEMFQDELKIIILFRNPVDRLYSNYIMHYKQGWIKKINFNDEYLEYFNNNQQNQYQQYDKIFNAWNSQFNSDQLKFIISEELFNDNNILKEISEWVGIEYKNQPLAKIAPFGRRPANYPKMNSVTRKKLLELHEPIINNLSQYIPTAKNWLTF